MRLGKFVRVSQSRVLIIVEAVSGSSERVCIRKQDHSENINLQDKVVRFPTTEKKQTNKAKPNMV